MRPPIALIVPRPHLERRTKFPTRRTMEPRPALSGRWQRDPVAAHPSHIGDHGMSDGKGAVYSREMVDGFLTECVEPGRFVTFSRLHAALVQWMNERGMQPMSSKGFTAALRARGFQYGPGMIPPSRSGVLVWPGIDLKAGVADRLSQTCDAAKTPRQNNADVLLAVVARCEVAENPAPVPLSNPDRRPPSTPVIRQSFEPVRELQGGVLRFRSWFSFRPWGRTGTVTEGGAAANGVPGGRAA